MKLDHSTMSVRNINIIFSMNKTYEDKQVIKKIENLKNSVNQLDIGDRHIMPKVYTFFQV